MTSSDTNSSSPEHPMTEATPLASEQITQEDREAAADWFYSPEEAVVSGPYCEMLRSGRDDGNTLIQAFARHRIAALSASPAPSEPTERQKALAAMTQMDEEIEAEHPGWMTGQASPASSGQGASGEVDDADAIMASRGVLHDDPLIAASHRRAMEDYADAKVAQFYHANCACRAAEKYVSTCVQHGTPKPAPAPSCAPGEVERLTARLRGHARDLRDQDWDEDNAAAADCDRAAAVLAALSPQGLDAATVERCAETALRHEVAAVINEMSRHMPHATEDWRARLLEALA